MATSPWRASDTDARSSDVAPRVPPPNACAPRSSSRHVLRGSDSDVTRERAEPSAARPPDRDPGNACCQSRSTAIQASSVNLARGADARVSYSFMKYLHAFAAAVGLAACTNPTSVNETDVPPSALRSTRPRPHPHPRPRPHPHPHPHPRPLRARPARAPPRPPPPPSSACPAGMLLVDGELCSEVIQNCLEFMDPAGGGNLAPLLALRAHRVHGGEGPAPLLHRS